MKPTARRSGRLHWTVFGVTCLLLALVAWREGRFLVLAVVCAAIGLGFLLWALRRDPDDPPGGEPPDVSKPVEPPRGMGPVRAVVFVVAIAFTLYPLIDLALHLTPYRLVWSGAHTIPPLHAHELVFVSTEQGEPRSGQVAWVPWESSAGSDLATILTVGPDSVRSGGFAEAWVVRTAAPVGEKPSPGRLSQLVRPITGGYDEASWPVPPHWVAVVYAMGAERDTGITIIPPEWLRGVGREVLFPRITRLP